jgi:hypothetical protein
VASSDGGDAGAVSEQRLGGWRGGVEDGVDDDVLEEADLDAEQDDLAEVRGDGKVFAAGAEVGEGEVAGASELNAEGEHGGVEIEDGTELNLDVELEGSGREGSAVENPASAVREGVGEERQDRGALVVAETLDGEWLHGDWGRRGSYFPS